MAEARQVIATISKNQKEEVRVALTEWNGREFVDVRIYTDLGDSDDLVPTRKGVSLRLDRLDRLIAALEAARTEATRRGLL